MINNTLLLTKAIFRELGTNPVPLDGLANVVGVNKSTVKRHIACMRNCMGLSIISDRDGYRVFCDKRWQTCRDFFNELT